MGVICVEAPGCDVCSSLASSSIIAHDWKTQNIIKFSCKGLISEQKPLLWSCMHPLSPESRVTPNMCILAPWKPSRQEPLTLQGAEDISCSGPEERVGRVTPAPQCGSWDHTFL